MDLLKFCTLDDAGKLDYVIDALKEARLLFASIYYRDSLSVDDDILSELEGIGDALFDYGEMTCCGLFEEIFPDLNLTINRLRELSVQIGYYS